MSGINVQIRDAAALERVYPTALRAYLADRGWVHQSTWRNRIMVWSKEQGGRTHEALVPLHELTGVYAVRISELIELLSGIEERSQLDVYYDLLGARADVIRLRPLRGGARTGWSLEESADLLGWARDLMLAAARAAERPGLPVYRGRSTGQVRDYVRSIQPLPGYGEGGELTLHSLVPAGFADQGYIDDDVKPPFPRQAMLSLNAGLQAAQSAVAAVQGGAGLSAFEQMAPQGINANLCEAMAMLARQNDGINLNLSWAGVRPSNATAAEYAFAPSSAEVFSSGADWLRRHTPFLNAYITGEIVRLEREPPRKYDGQATVMCQLDERPVTLHVQFDSADWDASLDAFRKGIEINLDCDIYRDGNKYYARTIRKFAVSTGAQ